MTDRLLEGAGGTTRILEGGTTVRILEGPTAGGGPGEEVFNPKMLLLGVGA